MTNRATRCLGILTAVALFGLAVSVGPMLAAGGDPDPRNPPPPSNDGKKPDKKKPQKRSDQEFLDGYRAARALVLHEMPRDAAKLLVDTGCEVL